MVEAEAGQCEGPEERQPLAQSGLVPGRLCDVARRYQQALKNNPQDVEALVGLGLVALASGQTAQAVQMARAGVEAAPQLGAAWVALGQALKGEGKMEEAEQAYRKALSLDGMDLLARLGLGELRLAQMRADEALAEFELALRKQPGVLAAQMGMGNAYALSDRFEEALEEYEKALSQSPRLPDAEFAAGFALMRLGRYEEAERRYRRAVRSRPDFAAAWLNLGCLEREQGRDIYAEASLLRAVQLRPDLVNAWINLGLVERDRHRPERAEKYLRTALELKPDSPDICVAWCQFRAGEEDYAGAWSWLRWALLRAPDHAEALNMLGILLHHEKRYEEAVAAFLRAEAVGHKAAASNRGNTLLDLGRCEDALEAQQLAARIDPESPGARYNLALTHLRTGRWRQGWPEYEARWHFRQVHKGPRLFKEPRWRGEQLHGEGILLHAEQGLGDTIQFSRYAELVAERGGRPLLLVQAAVDRLMHSLPVVRRGAADVVERGHLAAGFGYECPLMTLPAVFGTTVETTPWYGAYISAEPELVQEKLHLFPPAGLGPRVGIAWAGNPRYRADAQRSTELKTWLPLLRRPGFEWVSLQKDKATAQIRALPEDVRVVNGASREQNLAETAALIATVDMVVTTDTCMAHLAGAMGKPVWILLPHLSDWRWMQDRESSPWYPTARLLRQKEPGDWSGVLERAAEEIEAYRQHPWCGFAAEAGQSSCGAESAA